MPELSPNIHKAMMNSPSPVLPPSTAASQPPRTPGSRGSRTLVAQQRYRQVNMAVPKFRNAVITPTVTSHSVHVVRDVDDVNVHVYKK